MRGLLKITVVLAAFGIVLTGCTAEEAIKLSSEETQKGVTSLSSDLGDYARKSKALRKDLAQRIAERTQEIVGNAGQNAYNREFIVAVLSDHAKVFKGIQTAMENRAAIIAARDPIGTRRAEILATQTDLSVPAAELKAIADKLAKLLKEEDFEARVAFASALFEAIDAELKADKAASP